MELLEFEKGCRVRFRNGITVDILKKDGDYAGLGQVRWRRRKLRSAELPVLPLIRTADGFEVSRLQLREIRPGRDESLTLDLIPFVHRHGRTEWTGADGEEVWNVGPWDQEASRDRGGALRVVLRAVQRTIGGIAFCGFSYSYKYTSRKHHACRIHDRASWELGARATGTSFWMAGPGDEPQRHFTALSDRYTTAWHGGGRVRQFLPYFSVLQGFTFQFDDQSLLVTCFESPFHCLSLFQKDAGRNHIVHWHQLCGDLGGALEFPAQQVLAADLPTTSPAERSDQYCAVREDLQRQAAVRLGVAPEPLMPGGSLNPADGFTLQTLQSGIDRLARAGCTRIYVVGLCRHFAPARPDERAGREACRQIRRIVDHAHQRGAQVAASLLDCSEPWLVAACMETDTDAPQPPRPLSPGADGRELVSLALRGQDGGLLREHLRRVRAGLGIDALFGDGALAGYAGQFDRRVGQAASGAGAQGRVRSLFGARTALIADIARMGFGCLQTAPGAVPGCLRSVPYETLKGREYMFRDSILEYPPDAASGRSVDPVEVYFRACAHRLGYALPCEPRSRRGSRRADWWHTGVAPINQACQALREHMERSRMLPEDRGVIWTGVDPDVRVLWCFEPFSCPVAEDADVFDVLASRRVSAGDGTFPAEALRVYMIQNVGGP
ncbi:MAG: hypothetical protein GXY85_06985 [Candidatus Brocadiaceae bacterium]|nr:hypothetical protein [Candidatus Brocadiaceae bacterium]